METCLESRITHNAIIVMPGTQFLKLARVILLLSSADRCARESKAVLTGNVV